jgi:transcriptional regulator with XRE-family HTH domain
MTPGTLIRDARLDAGLTQAQLASRSGTSQATLSAYESESKVPSAVTLARILAAAGRRMTTVPASRPVLSPGAADLEERGRILRDVLELADRLPSRRSGALRYPRLNSVVDDTR